MNIEELIVEWFYKFYPNYIEEFTALKRFVKHNYNWDTYKQDGRVVFRNYKYGTEFTQIYSYYSGIDGAYNLVGYIRIAIIERSRGKWRFPPKKEDKPL